MLEEIEEAWKAYWLACKKREDAWDALKKAHERTEAAQKWENAAWEAWKVANDEVTRKAEAHNRALL